jgi:hypothetical protein
VASKSLADRWRLEVDDVVHGAASSMHIADGSMHLADVDTGMLGANGIGTLAVAVG